MVGSKVHQRLLASFLAGILSLTAVGCTGLTPAMRAQQQAFVADITHTAKEALKAMLQSPKIQALQGSVFGVVDVENESKQRLDTEQLTQMVLKTLQESGRDKFFAKRAVVEGDSEDSTIKKTAQMRSLTTPKPASLFLNTSIVQRTSEQHVENILILNVVKVATGLEVWSGEFAISHNP
ncbi:hypothetical protein NHP21005_00410 [Helicobacter sp. NHP21005]|uniref:hypothetical protein n=1 Tax=Helicobacter felistomachi TaxID=3040201 RepID=UPI00257220F9|nr:hypothetical protein [Helicobacter sp. NHP21005]BEG56353.1 hypothetical protein NHP21005_00410 [Helicobacter sp. NHP21005]